MTRISDEEASLVYFSPSFLGREELNFPGGGSSSNSGGEGGSALCSPIPVRRFTVSFSSLQPCESLSIARNHPISAATDIEAENEHEKESSVSILEQRTPEDANLRKEKNLVIT